MIFWTILEYLFWNILEYLFWNILEYLFWDILEYLFWTILEYLFWDMLEYLFWNILEYLFGIFWNMFLRNFAYTPKVHTPESGIWQFAGATLLASFGICLVQFLGP